MRQEQGEDPRNGAIGLVVFTDLDGTLVDPATHSAEHARTALSLLASGGVPVVLSSSRTRAEIEVFQEELQIRHPFICENGAAVYVPQGYFTDPVPRAVVRSNYLVVEYGLPYRDIVATVHRLARQLHVAIESFSQMSVEEVATAYGVSLLQARLAKLREHSEPFRFTDATPRARERLIRSLKAAGLNCLNDGRFYHAIGMADVAAGVRLLRSCYAGERPVVTIGLGDYVDDLPLLQEVDIPVIVQNATGRSSLELVRALPEAVLTRLFGPAGWADTIAGLVRRFGINPLRPRTPAAIRS